MLLGAWGARAGELLQGARHREGRHREGRHREGLLTTADPPHGAHGDWRCWLIGEPEARGNIEVCGDFEARGNAEARDEFEAHDERAAGGPPATAALADALARALAAESERAWGSLFGRFAAIAYDRARARCWVVRDQLGAQPLVYARIADGVLLAEHEHELLDALPRTAAPDRLALLAWIENGMPPAARTLYEGVERIPAGGRLALGGRVAVERWWRPRYEGVQRGAATELGERLRDAAFAAVGRAAARARRPAVKLSGGLDSACVAAGLAANGFATSDLAGDSALALGGAFAAYPEADERELIEATARHAGLALEVIAYDSGRSMLEPALAHIDRWRLPPGTPNLFLWQPLLARARQLGVDALLDGEGGDELFGLAAYLIADRLRSGRLASAWSLSGRIPGMGLHPERRVRLRVLRHYGVRPLVPASIRHRRQARAARRTSPNALMAPADRATLAALRAAGEERLEGPRWWQMQAYHLVGMREELDMGAHFRREALDAGLAIRHPLLHDLPLVEVALRLPPAAQFDAVRDRPLLRDALRGRIPEAVRTRHAKSHFTELVLAGMHGEEAQLIAPLRDAQAPVRAFLEPAALDRRLAVAPQDRPLLSAGLLWRIAIANRWLLSLEDAAPPARAHTFPHPYFFRP